MRIRTLVVSAFVFVAAVTGLISSGIFYHGSEQVIFEETALRLEAVADGRAHQLETFVEGHGTAVKSLASSRCLKTLLNTTDKTDSSYASRRGIVLEWFSEVLSNYPQMIRLALLNEQGEVIASSSLGDSLPEGISVADSLSSRGVSFKPALVGGKPSLVVCSPVESLEGGDFAGVLVADLNAEYLFDLVSERTGLGETEDVYLLAADGAVLTPSTSRRAPNSTKRFPPLARGLAVNTRGFATPSSKAFTRITAGNACSARLLPWSPWTPACWLKSTSKKSTTRRLPALEQAPR